MKEDWSQNFQFCLRNGIKSPSKKIKFLDLCNPNARYCLTALLPLSVHSEGVSRGGSVIVAVSVSDM